MLAHRHLAMSAMLCSACTLQRQLKNWPRGALVAGARRQRHTAMDRRARLAARRARRAAARNDLKDASCAAEEGVQGLARDPALGAGMRDEAARTGTGLDATASGLADESSAAGAGHRRTHCASKACRELAATTGPAARMVRA